MVLRKSYLTPEKNIVKNCLLLKKRDKFLIICDNENEKIGKKIYKEGEKIAKKLLYISLDEYQRPLIKVPKKLKEKISKFKPTASIYIASSLPGEIKFRIKLIHFLVHQLKVRHAHCPGISEKIWKTGLKGDYRKIEKFTNKIYRIVKNVKEIEVYSKEGTSLIVKGFYNWVKDTGVFRNQGTFGNLPAGEVFTCPRKANGVFVARILGDYLIKYGLLKKKEAVKLYIENSYIKDVECSNKEIKEELEKYLFEGKKCYRRIGEFAFGTNIFLKKPIGNLLQDEKLPTIHIAAGDPYKEETKANYSCDKHIDFITLNATAKVDNKVIMKDGKYLVKF